MSCSVAGGSLDAGMPRPAKPGVGVPGRTARAPNIIITGTGPLASAGVTKVIWMSTLMAGAAELSAWPTNWRAVTGCAPTVVLTVLVTVQVIFGAFFGT